MRALGDDALQRRLAGLFTTDKPVIFAHHGYPMLIHRLTYRRTNHRNIHVRGYKEEGTTTTPFDMVVRNDLDRFHLASDVIDRVPKLGYMAAYAKPALRDKLIEHKQYSRATAMTCPRSRTGAGPRRAPEGARKNRKQVGLVSPGCSSETPPARMPIEILKARFAPASRPCIPKD
jgi:XFP C-terminal domain